MRPNPKALTMTDPSKLAFRKFVERVHTLARQAIADPSNAATILAPLLLLVEPVDPVEEWAREVWERAREAFLTPIAYNGQDNQAAIAVIANALRQGADHA